MVKCKVCMTEYEESKNDVCPVCSFDQPYGLGEDNEEINRYIAEEKLRLLKSLDTGIETFSYEISETAADYFGSSVDRFPKITEFGKPCIFEKQFSPLGTKEKFDIALNIRFKDHTFRPVISVKNIKSAENLTVSISVDKEFNITAELKDERGTAERSEKTYIFRNGS